MSRNERRWIMFLIILLVVVIVGVVIMNKNKGKEEVQQPQNVQVNEEKYTEVLEDGTKINTSQEFNNKKRYKSLEISNIQYTEKDGMSVLLADVKNMGSTKHEIEIVRITILGENGEEITKIKPVIGNIEPGETIKLNASITADVANAKDFKIEEMK